jgi:hypothetical protein
MTKIKTFIATMAIVFSANVLLADTIDIIVPSNEGGGIFTLSNFVSKELAKQGIITSVQVKGECVNGMSRFRQTTKPSILITSSGSGAGLSNRKGCDIHDGKEFESVYLTSLLTAVDGLFTTKNLTIKDLQNGKEYIVGVDISRKDRATSVLSQLKIKHKIIVYGNASKAIQGLVAGDSDVAWTNAKETKKVQKVGGKALFIANKNGMNGVQGLSAISSVDANGLSNYYWILTKNLTSKQKQKLIESFKIIKQGKEIKALSDKSWLPLVENDTLAKVEIKNFVLNLK